MQLREAVKDNLVSLVFTSLNVFIYSFILYSLYFLYITKHLYLQLCL